MNTTRRGWVHGAAAALLSASAETSARADRPQQGLKDIAPFPVGTCLATSDLSDPVRRALTLHHFSQVTPEWEMKMEKVLGEDGSYHFEAADTLARFCSDQGLLLHGTTLVWYAQDPVAFERLAGDKKRFEQAYRQYISAVVGRYRGLARGWDVVNEAVSETGDGYRGGVWERVLGPDYARIAFEVCRDVHPEAVRFLNDYNLELLPAKLDSFQRLLERLLKAGAPVSGVGTQTHLSIDAPRGRAGAAVKALARFGLPLHVSELDVSTRVRGAFATLDPDRLQKQARVVGEVAEAFMELPPSQRYAFTSWGVRDQDSWLRRAPHGDPHDEPLLFDDRARPKPAFDALKMVFAQRRR